MATQRDADRRDRIAALQGEPGDDGEDGEPGQPGEDGASGKDGLPGQGGRRLVCTVAQSGGAAGSRALLLRNGKVHATGTAKRLLATRALKPGGYVLKVGGEPSRVTVVIQRR